MKPLTLLAPLAVLLLAVPLHGASSPGEVAGPQWWGPEDVGQGFHIRVPVTVRNDLSHTVDNGVVLAHIDLTAALVDAGWVHDVGGLRERLSSFELDPESVRVVEMHDLEPTKPGTQNGTLLAHDPTIAPDDPARYEVPSTYFQGFVETADPAAFDHRTNPTLTVLWRVFGESQPGDERHYVVYVDSLTNARHDPPDYSRTPGTDLVEGAYWTGPGTDLIGYARPGSGEASVRVLGLYPDTTVTVWVATDAGSFVKLAPQASQPNPIVLDADQMRRVPLGVEPTAVRLSADKPILAVAESEGYVPARSGGFAGHDFLFATTYDSAAKQDSLYLINLNPATPALVELQSLEPEGGPIVTREIHFSDDENFLPYTVGRRATSSDDQCGFFQNPENLAVDPAPTFYRARVVEGGPVAIQYDAVEGITPVPAIGQGPMGQDFMSVLARRNFPNEPASCTQSVVEAYGIFAASRETTNLEIHSWEKPDRVYPPQVDPPHAFGPLDQALRLTIDVGDQTDRPLQLRTEAPTWLMTGRADQPSLRDVPLRGPLGGGDAGREFAGFGNAILYAPYAGTIVTMGIMGSTDPIPFALAQGRAVPLAEASGRTDVRDLWYQLNASRPIVVVPTAATSGFLAGIPPLLTSDVHLDRAEYRGYLVDIASPSGFNPVARATTPGAAAEYPLIVTNRGHGAHGVDLPDVVEVCPQAPPPGWEATLDGAAGCVNMGLSSGESRSVTLRVAPPSDAAAGDEAFVEVRATSGANPAVSDAVGTVTTVKSTFDVGLWFDFVKGSKIGEGSVFANDESFEYTLVVKNLGSVENLITVDFTPPDEGWHVQLDGQEEVQVTLAPDATTSLTLNVTAPPPPPEGIAEGTLITTVTATSFLPAHKDTAAAITTLQAPSDVRLDVDDPVVWVAPGAEAVFGVTVRNEGDGTTQILFDVQHDDLPGWNPPDVFLIDPQTGERTPVDQLSALPGDVLPLAVVAGAPDDADAWQRNSIRLNVATDTAGENLEAFLHAIVEPVHQINAHVAAAPARTDPGTEVPVEVRLTNDGNLDERLTPGVASVPPGWSVAFPQEADHVLIPRNGTQPLELRINVPDGAVTGTYTVALRLVSDDGNTTHVSIQIPVGRFADYTVSTPESVMAQPGRPANVAVALVNTGNTPVTFHIEALDAEPWPLDVAAPPPRHAPPGASSRLTAAWAVPADAPDGTSTHRFELVMRPDDPNAPTQRRVIDVDVDVGRANIRVAEAVAFEGAAGRIVTTVVQNDGTRTAYDAAVELRVGTQTVDELTLAEMAPGAVHNVTFLQPEGNPGDATIVLDSAGSVVEADETDNAFPVAASADPQASGPAWGSLVLAVVGVAWLRSRRHGL